MNSCLHGETLAELLAFSAVLAVQLRGPLSGLPSIAVASSACSSFNNVQLDSVPAGRIMEGGQFAGGQYLGTDSKLLTQRFSPLETKG